MAIADLLTVVKPPVTPTAPGNVAGWRQVEAELGLELPTDYKQFIAHYGDCIVGRALFLIVNPFVDNLRAYAEQVIANIHEVSSDPKDYPFYPDRPGLLPCGSAMGGDHVFWLTAGEPDEWTIVMGDCQDTDFSAYPYSLTAFLAGVMSGRAGFPLTDYAQTYPEAAREVTVVPPKA